MRISDWSSDVCSSDLWMRTISNESACAIAFRHGARWRKISWSQRRPDTVIRGAQTMLSRILPLTMLLLMVTSLYAQAASHRVLVYEDRNGNGQRDGGEPGLAGDRKSTRLNSSH